MTISGGLKYLTEEISFRKNNLHHLTPHVRISHKVLPRTFKNNHKEISLRVQRSDETHVSCDVIERKCPESHVMVRRTRSRQLPIESY